MQILRKSLKNCGYNGPCQSESILVWAIRTGSCSHFYNELLNWLETHLHSITCSSFQIRRNIQNLLQTLRISTLMIPHDGMETALNPKEFRLQTLKVLTHQLQLSMERESTHWRESPQRGQDSKHAVYGRQLSITLNMQKRSHDGNWNERLVRYNRNVLVNE